MPGLATPISTASSPNSVVNLMIGFSATDEVSLYGSPTVSPTTVAACRSVPFWFSSTSTTFLALSQAPPALAMYTAWNRPTTAMETRYEMKNSGRKNAYASVRQKITMKMLNMPACAYWVQIRTTVFDDSIVAAAAESRWMLRLMYSTARYAPVVTACMDAPVNQYTVAPPISRPSST